MPYIKTNLRLSPIAISIALAVSSNAFAADFTIPSGTTVTSTQTIGANETGTIEAGAQLNTGASNAVNASGNNHTVNNAGSISTTGGGARGIDSSSSGTNASLINSGSIATAGGNAHGIVGTRPSTTFTNSGTITTSGNGAKGIRASGIDAVVNNSGSITTSGSSGRGIETTQDNAVITNTGDINTSGNLAQGISAINDNVTINHHGSIVTTGTDAHGIRARDDSTINVSGSIKATGAGAKAILGEGGSQTVNLLPGSQVSGEIDLGAGNDTLNVQKGAAQGFTVNNIENINLFTPGIVVGNQVITVDPTGDSAVPVMVSNFSNLVHGHIHQRMIHVKDLKPVKLAALTVSPSMMPQARKPLVWGGIVGGNFERDAEGDALAYESSQAGIVGGYEQDIGQTRVGFFAGYMHGNTSSVTTSFNTDTDRYYAGAYGRFNLGGVANLTASLLAGYGDHDHHRTVFFGGDKQIAKSNYDSKLISPAISISTAYQATDKIELRPYLGVSYTVARLDGYTESGSSTNLKVDDRTVRVFNTKVQLKAAYAFTQGSEVSFRVGARARNINADDIDVTILGNQFSYDNAGDDNVSGAFAGLNLRVATVNNFDLMVDVELGGDSDEDYQRGQLSLNYHF